MQPFFSLVCVTNNRRSEFERLLDSLLLQAKIFELIIIDQNKNCLIEDLVSNYSKHFDIIHKKVSFNNLSKGRNLGVKYSRGKVLCFPDDDCWYSPDFFSGLEKYLAVNPGIKLGCTNWVDPSQDPKIYMFSGDNGVFDKPTLFKNAASICIFVYKELFSKSDGFNEKFGLGDDSIVKAGEDQEFLLRLSMNVNAYKVYDIYVCHLISARVWNKYMENRIVGSGASDFYIKRKYISKGQAYMDVLWWVVGALYNLVRFRKKNFKWYYLKLKGVFSLVSKINNDKYSVIKA